MNLSRSDELTEFCRQQGLPDDAPLDRILDHVRGNAALAAAFDHLATQPDWRSVIRRLLDGDTPQGNKWYGTDEDGCAMGKGHPITDAEMAALTDACAAPKSDSLGAH